MDQINPKAKSVHIPKNSMVYWCFASLYAAKYQHRHGRGSDTVSACIYANRIPHAKNSKKGFKRYNRQQYTYVFLSVL